MDAKKISSCVPLFVDVICQRVAGNGDAYNFEKGDVHYVGTTDGKKKSGKMTFFAGRKKRISRFIPGAMTPTTVPFPFPPLETTFALSNIQNLHPPPFLSVSRKSI